MAVRALSLSLIDRIEVSACLCVFISVLVTVIWVLLSQLFRVLYYLSYTQNIDVKELFYNIFAVVYCL